MVDTQTADSLDIAVIGGDGIGPEVVAEGLKVLSAVAASSGFTVNTSGYDLGARRWLATGETLPDSALAEIRGHDAILLGAVGDPSVPSGVLERGLLLKLRFALDHYVNLRPVRLYPGVQSPLVLERVAPDGIDFVVVPKAPRGRMSATAALCASVHRPRSPPRSVSTPGMAWSASCVTRSPAPRPGIAST
jgi:3-isopropylmalate dehydrogenase